MDLLVVLSRWVHVMSAMLAIGGVFFLRVVLPPALAEADAGSREAVHLRARRVFKRVVHTCVLLLLLTGAFNTWANWDMYKLNRPLLHGLWGPHLLLGLIAMVVSILILAGDRPKAWAKTGAAINIALLGVVVLLASSLKWARDSEMKKRMVVPPAAPSSAVVGDVR